MIQTNPSIADKPCSSSSNTDCLPLHFVLMHGFGCEWKTITMIAKAAPRAFAIRDPIHHFYPFLLTACDPPIQYNDKDRLGQYKKWFVRYDLEQLNSVFMLLRESAWVMNFLVQNYRTN